MFVCFHPRVCVSFQVSFTPVTLQQRAVWARRSGRWSVFFHRLVRGRWEAGGRGGTIGVSMAMNVPNLPPSLPPSLPPVLPCGWMENKGTAAHLSHLELTASGGRGLSMHHGDKQRHESRGMSQRLSGSPRRFPRTAARDPPPGCSTSEPRPLLPH